MRLLFLALLFSLSGCTPVVDKYEFVESCFEPFTKETHSLFDLRENETVYVEPFRGNSKGIQFFRKHHFKGYIFDGSDIARDQPINGYDSLLFTGNVIKEWPGWLGYYIGGNRNGFFFEVTLNDTMYLFPDFQMRDEFIESMPERCKIN